MAALALSEKDIETLQGNVRASILQVIVKHLEQCKERQDFEKCMWRMTATMKGAEDDEKKVDKEQLKLSPLIDFEQKDVANKGMCPLGHVKTSWGFVSVLCSLTLRRQQT